MPTTVPSPIFQRLPHIVPRGTLVSLLAQTYGTSVCVDDSEAIERLTRALGEASMRDALYNGLESALRVAMGKRLTEEAVMDKLSQRLQTKHSVKPPTVTPEISAALVSISLAAGECSDSMRGPLETDRGRAMVAAGCRALGTHLVKELLK